MSDKNNIVIFNKDLRQDVAVAGLRCVTLNITRKFVVAVVIPEKILASIEKDGKMAHMMNDAVKVHYAKFCKVAQDLQKNHDKLLLLEPDPEQRTRMLKAMEGAWNASQDVFEEEACKAVKKVWESYRTMKKEYRSYQIGIAANIGGSLAIGATSVGLMASAPFTGGLGAAAGIIGAAKSGIVVTKEIISAWQEIETSQEILGLQIKFVTHAANGMLARRVNEYAADVVSGFLDISQPSIEKCMKHLETVRQKLNGIEIQIHKLTIQINELLDHQKKLEKEFLSQVDRRYQQVAAAKEDPKKIERALDQILQPSMHAIMNMIPKVRAMEDRWQLAKNTTKALADQIEPLKGQRNITNNLLRMCVSLGQIPMGALHGNEISHEATEIIKGLVPVAADFVYSKICSKVFNGTLLEA